MKKAIMCWSGGKDSALCLYKVLQGKMYDVKYLFTAINENFKRVSMHGVREELIERQSQSIGIPLVKMYVREGTNTEYEQKMEEQLLKFKGEEIEHVIFGDIFLEDLRKYREDNLKKINMRGVFPLWKKDTRQLIKEFLSLNFKTIICCTNASFLSNEWVGKIIDENFLSELPSEADACGENGEFHTFCFLGPVFSKTIPVKTGKKIFKPVEVKIQDASGYSSSATPGFWFCDLIPADNNSPLTC